MPACLPILKKEKKNQKLQLPSHPIVWDLGFGEREREIKGDI